MMKKLRIVVLLFILAFSFSAQAEVILEVDCNGKEISSDKSVTCEGNLLYENEGITDIEFDYQTNLDVKFISTTGFMVTNRGGKVTVHSDTPLQDEIMNSAKIMEFTLSYNDKLQEKEKFIISNVKINNASDIKVAGVTKEFKVTGATNNKLDDVCTLDSITVEKVKIKDFSKDKLEYRGIEVTNEVIFIDAVRTSSKSSAIGLGNVIVPKGETIERDIVVTAEDGTNKNIYKLFITNTTEKDTDDEPRPDEGERSSDNTLKSLELYHGKKKVKLTFDRKKEVYSVQVDDDLTAKLTIKAILNDPKATFVDEYGPRDVEINYGYNKELIKIQAEDGSEKTITLSINYLDNRDKDNSLLSLIINGKEVDLASDELEVRLPSDTLKTEIEAVPSSTKSKVEYEDIELSLGDNNVNITVTSEDGEKEEYNVNVIRENEKDLLESITVTGYDIGFSKDKTTYNLKINNDTNELKIIVNPSVVKHEILNNKDLKNGSKILIKITDDEKSYEYTINIEKEESSSDIICYIIFGIGVISLILSIIYFIKKSKIKNK